MFSNIRWSIGPAFQFNTHSITENNVSLQQELRRSLSKKRFDFLLGNASSSNLQFSATRKKKEGLLLLPPLVINVSIITI